MTDGEWGLWVELHASLFWMRSPEDADLFGCWKPLLSDYSHAELVEASRFIATNHSSKFRTLHLELIRSRVQAVRLQRWHAERQAFEAANGRTTCEICEGAGYVSVPHPAQIVNDRWVHPHCTLAVSCSCDRGKHRHNAMQGGLDERRKQYGGAEKVMHGLEAYEYQHPHWRDLVAERDASRKLEERAAWKAKAADKESPIDFEQVAAQLAAKKGGA